MPRQRVTPDIGITPPVGRPTGSPTDTFRPFSGNAASQPLEDLARSLSRFGGQTGTFYEKLRERENRQQAEAGRQAVLQAAKDQEDTAKAIRELRMRPSQSAWFRHGVETAAGGLSAMRARDHFVATRGDALQEATTLDEFDALAEEALNEFQEEFGVEPSEAYNNGFFPQYLAQITQLRYQFATGLDGKLTDNFVKSWGATQYENLAAVYSAGGDLIAAAEDISSGMDEAILLNPKMAGAIKDATIANLKSLAMRYGDGRFLDMAERIRVGPAEQGEKRPTLYAEYATGDGGLDQARQALADLLYKRDSQDHQRLQIQRAEDLQSTAISVAKLVTTGNITDPDVRAQAEAMIDRLAETNPLGAQQVYAMLDAKVRFADHTDMETYDNLRWGIEQGEVNFQRIFAARDRLSQMDSERLYGILEAKLNSDKDPEAQEVLRLAPVLLWQGRIEKRFTDLMTTGPEDQIAGQNAISEFRLRLISRGPELLELYRANPNDPKIEEIVQAEARSASIIAARAADLELTGMIDESGISVGAQTPEPEDADKLATRFTPNQLAQAYLWRQNGTLNVANPEQKRFKAVWETWRPDIAYGSEAMFDLIDQMAAIQGRQGGN